ncbi:SRPBCC family protein [Methylococcus sp. EFPC2]|uniref:SRPBCC family protein n=1 Tax=Methylococcus sp. EFPC2 TaxID=2812648 RepID=UPI0019684E41|nr:SRPBCC family protein [Methylococcus sp. EFPC2]QSA97893.1 SRPBCC family protein [Methylococcus sp. EFPC2]
MSTNNRLIAADREIRSSRHFQVSRERLFAEWSDPDRLAQWWGPEGFTNTFHEFDLRPGGRWHFIMHGPDGTDYPNENIFIEVKKAERIVFRHVFAPVFQMTVDFTEQAGGTRLDWLMLFETAEVCEKFRALCTEANEQNFDRLAHQLAVCAS